MNPSRSWVSTQIRGYIHVFDRSNTVSIVYNMTRMSTAARSTPRPALYLRSTGSITYPETGVQYAGPLEHDPSDISAEAVFMTKWSDGRAFPNLGGQPPFMESWIFVLVLSHAPGLFDKTDYALSSGYVLLFKRNVLPMMYVMPMDWISRLLSKTVTHGLISSLVITLPGSINPDLNLSQMSSESVDQ